MSEQPERKIVVIGDSVGIRWDSARMNEEEARKLAESVLDGTHAGPRASKKPKR